MPGEISQRDRVPLEGFPRFVREHGGLAKLDGLSRNTLGLALVVLLRREGGRTELLATGGPDDLPEFCRALRSTPHGRKCCRACRSLVAYGACGRGPIAYECHGGTTILAAPARLRDGRTSERLVVAACAVLRPSHAQGWRAVAPRARSLGLDLRRLKRGYYALPVLDADKRRLAQDVIDLAAATLGDIEDSIPGAPVPAMPVDPAGLPALLGPTRDPSFRREGPATGSALVDLIVETVRRDPAFPYSVAGIAHAASLTPNYFSTLFRKHTGQTFGDFLTETRLVRARTLLRDPTLPIGEVARRSGFDDPAYFSRRFRQAMGVSPSGWRNGAHDG